jgi:hypothetical protein
MGMIIDRSRLSEYILSRQPDGLFKWVKDQTFRHIRNKNEAIQWAQVIDDMVTGDRVDIKTSIALERAVRRLMGVHTADHTGSWDVCTALQMDDTTTTLLPPLIFDRAIKRSAQLARFHPSSSSYDMMNDDNVMNRGGGKKKYNNDNKNFKRQPRYNNNHNNNNHHNARQGQGNDNRPRYHNNDNHRGQHAPDPVARN